MSVTATPGAARLALSYGDGGSYAQGGIRPSASAEELLRTARAISVFQEGSLRDVYSHADWALEEG